MKTVSQVEKLILNKNFKYSPPYFYNNKLALRCELGAGNDNKEYLRTAKSRAAEIFDILFKSGVDAFFFDNYMYDNDFDAGEKVYINRIVASEKRRLKFSLGYQKNFKHAVVRDIPFDKEDNEELIKINRIVCYPDNQFDASEVINSQIDGSENALIHFVSFENECILSGYDDRGCDIVFFDKEKFKSFYPLLEKYFLGYDLELMKKRLAEAL